LNKVKRIKFLATHKHVMEVREKPIPAQNLIPEWWKKMSPYSSLDGKFHLNPNPTVTAKKCFPLLDAISSGYIVKLWADLLVTEDPLGNKIIKWNTSEEVVESWPHDQSNGYEIPEGFSKTVFKYLHGWIIQTPKNYSCLITHPIGYPNMPIKTLTGIVDTDSLKTLANSPFVVREDFKGIIEKGTPMFQIIPFKRDVWESEYSVMGLEESFLNQEKLSSIMVSSYGRFLREKKSFK
jgi:hypothetical protein